MKATKKQKKLTKEINEILENEYLNPQEIIKNSEDQDEVDAQLNIAKDRLIRIVIISDYVLINELVDQIICNYFFGKKTTWKSEKYRLFNQYILENASLLNKLGIMEEFFKLQRSGHDFICSLNGLRNAFAHSFFPENRRREKPIYKKKDIYKIEVIREYKEDYDKTIGLLMEKAYGIKRKDSD